MTRRASRYKRRMALQSFTETRTPSKQLIKVWSDEAPFWGRVEFAYKGEEIIGGVRDSEVTQVASVSQIWVYLRYRSDLLFSPVKRVRFGDRFLGIVTAYDASDERREIRLLCMEVQA
jgi:head-tail adaptor